MNFDWNDEQRAFRATVRDFLEQNLPPEWEEMAHGPGSEAQTVFSKQFCGALAEAWKRCRGNEASGVSSSAAAKSRAVW